MEERKIQVVMVTGAFGSGGSYLVENILENHHEEDFTVLTQKEILGTFNSILNLDDEDKTCILYTIDNLIKATRFKTL